MKGNNKVIGLPVPCSFISRTMEKFINLVIKNIRYSHSQGLLG